MNNEEKILAMLEQLQQGQVEMRADIAKIDERTAHIEQEHGRKINGIYESIVGTGEKFNRLDLVESRVDDHDHRLFAVEEQLKKAK